MEVRSLRDKNMTHLFTCQIPSATFWLKIDLLHKNVKQCWFVKKNVKKKTDKKRKHSVKVCCELRHMFRRNNFNLMTCRLRCFIEYCLSFRRNTVSVTLSVTQIQVNSTQALYAVRLPSSLNRNSTRITHPVWLLFKTKPD